MLVRKLFTGGFGLLFEPLACSINTAKVSNGAVGDVGEEQDSESELFEEEGGAES